MECNTISILEKFPKSSKSENSSFDDTVKPAPAKKRRLKKKDKAEKASESLSEQIKSGNSNEQHTSVDGNNNRVLCSNLTGNEEATKANGNSDRKWNLASFLFPDNNLPQSWLGIMEANKKMSPFDDLNNRAAKSLRTDKDKALVSTVTTDETPDTVNSTETEIISITDSPDSPDAESVILCDEFPTTERESVFKYEIKDPELAAMPELTLSVPGKAFPMGNDDKQDMEIELSTDAPKIQPYDSEVIEKSNELPKLIKEIKSDKDETQEVSPEVAIQIRIVETRRTRKLGLPSPTTVSAKSLKRKYGSIVNQQHQVLNHRIKTQILAMQRETKKKFPDIEFLRRNMCLEESFKYRMAKFIKDNEHSIEDLLKEFPALKIVSIIMDEFERVVEVTNPMVRCNPITFLENALKKRFQRIITKFQLMPSKERLPIITTALEKLDEDPHNENLKKIVSSLCMIVNFAVDKCISSVITFTKEKESFNYRSIGLPKMIMKEKSLLMEQSQIRVFLEGQEIFKVASIYEGLLAIFAISHVFNLDYESKIEPLMSYFEYLVDIPQVLFQEEDPLPSDDEV